jgi:hypothetical protein
MQRLGLGAGQATERAYASTTTILGVTINNVTGAA